MMNWLKAEREKHSPKEHLLLTSWVWEDLIWEEIKSQKVVSILGVSLSWVVNVCVCSEWFLVLVMIFGLLRLTLSNTSNLTTLEGHL